MEKFTLKIARSQIIPGLGALVSLVLLAASLFGNQILYTLFFSVIFGACLFYLIRHQPEPFPIESVRYSSKSFKTLAAAFFTLLALSIVAFQLRPLEYSRPLSFIILVSLLVAVLFSQAISSPSKKIQTLLQTIIAGAVIIIPILSLSKTPLGVDPWHHQKFAELVVSTGHLPEMYYQSRPMFQLSFSGLLIIGNMDYMMASMLSFVTLSTIAILFIYLIARCVFEDARISLASAVLIPVGVYFIRNGYWLIASSFGFVMILPIVYVIVMTTSKGSMSYKLLAPMALLVIFGAATHPYPMICLFLIMLIYVISARVRGFPRLTFHLLLLFGAGTIFTLFWWGYFSDDLRHVMPALKSFLRFGGTIDVSTTNLYSYNLHDELLASSGFLGTLVVATMGFLHVNRDIRQRNIRVFAWISLGITAGVMATLVMNVHLFGARWLFFSMMLCSTLVALFLVNFTYKNPKKLKPMTTLIIIIALSFLSINSTICNEDNHELYSSVRDSQFLTDSQIITAFYSRDYLKCEVGSNKYFASRMSYFGAKGVTITDSTRESRLAEVMITTVPDSQNVFMVRFKDYTHKAYSSGEICGALLFERQPSLF